MLFAAGLGTRLRPLTDTRPKALVEVAGVPILERVARRLVAAGADRLVVNAHHFADQIERFVEARAGFGVETLVSREALEPLETGGGLRAARPLFRADAPIFLHNTDIVTASPLRDVYRAHLADRPLATLVVQERESSRRLIFDDAGLCGREDARTGAVEWAREPAGDTVRLPFSGIHVVAPEIFDLLTEPGAFSIMDAYLRLAGEGHRIAPFDAGGALWLEIGNPDRLRRAEETVARLERGAAP